MRVRRNSWIVRVVRLQKGAIKRIHAVERVRKRKALRLRRERHSPRARAVRYAARTKAPGYRFAAMGSPMIDLFCARV